jgi:hypothetical protein
MALHPMTVLVIPPLKLQHPMSRRGIQLRLQTLNTRDDRQVLIIIDIASAFSWISSGIINLSLLSIVYKRNNEAIKQPNTLYNLPRKKS